MTCRLTNDPCDDDLTDPTVTMAILRLQLNGVPLHLVLHEVDVDGTGRVARVRSDGGDQLWALLDLCENDDPAVVAAAGRHWVAVAEPYQR